MYNYEGKLIFEGEYLNGEQLGYGKEFYDDGKVRFEGEYFNGEKNGIIKEYDENGEIISECEYLNAEIWRKEFISQYFNYSNPRRFNNHFEEQNKEKYREYDDNGKIKLKVY